jgi:5-oxopent-3-ene-1,2,5-tricarboxylate decarboxylase / 2-hydroxyhepta-2,4-diene-1,7-dioate isomerase
MTKTAWLNLHGHPAPLCAEVDPLRHRVHLGSREFAVAEERWEVPTRGNVYGVALNFRGALAALGNATSAPPYQAPPRAPILYLKPRNTRIGYGVPIPIPAGIEAVAVGPTLGVVLGRDAYRVSPPDALQCIAGYTLVNDLTIPHESYYRPALKQKCRDGFCPIGPWIVEREQLGSVDALAIRAYVNGTLALENTTANLIRPVPDLIADISAFMTLSAGDVLLVGLPENLPLARSGDRVAVEIDGIGRLENPLVAEATAPRLA